MKNALKALIVALTTLTFSAIGLAQTKTPAPSAPTAPAMEKKSETAAEKTSEKSDDAAKTKTKGKTKTKSKTKRSTKKPAEKMKTEEKQGDTMEKKTK
jgi:hypothetical protein